MSQNWTSGPDLDDRKVYVEVAGEGPPLVFLHAGFVDSGMWDHQWGEFSKRHKVIRYDMAGYGKSDKPEGSTFRRQELYRVLDDAGVKRATLIGCSMGGETAIDAALERPELVSTLVIVSSAPNGFEMPGEPPEEFLELIEAIQQDDLPRSLELEMRLWVDGPHRHPGQVDPLVRQRAAGMSQNSLAKGAGKLMFLESPDPLDPPAAQRLDQIHVPTLIIAGELDHAIILQAADLMGGAIAKALKVILPECAHLPNMEKPAEFNRVVWDFLAAVQ